MTALVFVDTNVLVYAADEGVPAKNAAARAWRAELWRSRRGRVSFQVLQELYVTVTQKKLAARKEAQAEVRDLLAWKPVPTDEAVLERAWTLQDRFQLSFWDALIVAAAQVARCRYLLSEDFQSGQDFGGVEVANPFTTAPDALP